MLPSQPAYSLWPSIRRPFLKPEVSVRCLEGLQLPGEAGARGAVGATPGRPPPKGARVESAGPLTQAPPAPLVGLGEGSPLSSLGQHSKTMKLISRSHIFLIFLWEALLPPSLHHTPCFAAHSTC